jgi:hypothetical protein
MKIKTLFIASLIAGSGVSYGAAGIFDELIWTTTVTPFAYGTSTFFEIDSDTTNLFGASEFHGASLGSFALGSQLFLAGQQKSFKNNSTDVTGHTLFWSLNGGLTSQSLGYGFQADLGGGDQRWGTDHTGGLTSNILSGLTPGNYTLSVWTSISTNGTNADSTIFNNRGGANYNATFTVIPEPTAALLGSLGMLGLLRRRR